MQDIEKIYEEYFETVNKYLFCLTRSDNLAEELTQETFYRAVKKIDTYKGDCKMSVWLCQIAKNIWYDYCRRKKISNDIEKDEILNKQYTESTEENFIKNEEKTTSLLLISDPSS